MKNLLYIYAMQYIKYIIELKSYNKIDCWTLSKSKVY